MFHMPRLLLLDVLFEFRKEKRQSDDSDQGQVNVKGHTAGNLL